MIPILILHTSSFLIWRSWNYVPDCLERMTVWLTNASPVKSSVRYISKEQFSKDTCTLQNRNFERTIRHLRSSDAAGDHLLSSSTFFLLSSSNLRKIPEEEIELTKPERSHLSRDMTKPTKWVCAQRRLRSAWASVQPDQSLRWPHEESLGP